jgi:hypothetical protein
MLVAMLALLVSLSGTATAAHLLITSRNIKDGTIQLVDLSPHTKASLDKHAKTAELAEQARALKDSASHRLILASTTPAAGMLLPLDRQGHLPASVLPTIAARIYSSTDQTSPTQVVGDPVQRLQFDTVSFDTDHIFDPRRPSDLTAPVDGIYLITTNVAWPLQPNARAGVNRAVYVFVNDRVIAADQRPPTDGTLQTVTTLYKLQAGDVVDVGIAHDAPTLTAQALPDYAPSLAIALIAPGR